MLARTPRTESLLPRDTRGGTRDHQQSAVSSEPAFPLEPGHGQVALVVELLAPVAAPVLGPPVPVPPGVRADDRARRPVPPQPSDVPLGVLGEGVEAVPGALGVVRRPRRRVRRPPDVVRERGHGQRGPVAVLGRDGGVRERRAAEEGPLPPLVAVGREEVFLLPDRAAVPLSGLPAREFPRLARVAGAEAQLALVQRLRLGVLWAKGDERRDVSRTGSGGRGRGARAQRRRARHARLTRSDISMYGSELYLSFTNRPLSAFLGSFCVTNCFSFQRSGSLSWFPLYGSPMEVYPWG